MFTSWCLSVAVVAVWNVCRFSPLNPRRLSPEYVGGVHRPQKGTAICLQLQF
jgi:hypothetical protein